VNKEETYEFMEKLWHVAMWQFDYNCFLEIYQTESLAEHMWKKYNNDCVCNLLNFWRSNDLINKKRLVDYINSEKAQAKFYEEHWKYVVG